MGQKQKQVLEPSPDNETTKRRRVAFTGIGYEDVGVEAKDCIRIFLVSSKEEFEDPESFVINPVDLNSYFDNDGKIFGYKGLKVMELEMNLIFNLGCGFALMAKGIVEMEASIMDGPK